jgi:hypothetical protein
MAEQIHRVQPSNSVLVRLDSFAASMTAFDAASACIDFPTEVRTNSPCDYLMLDLVKNNITHSLATQHPRKLSYDFERVRLKMQNIAPRRDGIYKNQAACII